MDDSETSTGSTACGCATCLFMFIGLLVFVIISWPNFKNPNFFLDQTSVTSFNITPDGHLTGMFGVVMRAENPNQKYEFMYYNVGVKIWKDGQELAKDIVRNFAQRKGNGQIITSSLDLPTYTNSPRILSYPSYILPYPSRILSYSQGNVMSHVTVFRAEPIALNVTLKNGLAFDFGIERGMGYLEFDVFVEGMANGYDLEVYCLGRVNFSSFSPISDIYAQNSQSTECDVRLTSSSTGA